MQIKFCGAARTVTGSSHLIILDNGFKILLDCGMYQGADSHFGEANEKFEFNPAEIDCVVLSHAHIDHSGRLPKLLKDGYKGPIHCTTATADLCEVMLQDSAHIQGRDIEYVNRRRAHKKLPLLNSLYAENDVKATLALIKTHEYENAFEIAPGVHVVYRDSGHILGAGSITLSIDAGGKTTRIGFTGDIGRPNRPILKDPVPMDELDYLISESTYGGRLHVAYPNDLDTLWNILQKALVRQGKIIIPAFSVGRTQEVLYMLDQLYNAHKIDRLPVYVDSPLSTNTTEIYKHHPECFDEEILNHMKNDPNPFGFNTLTFTKSVEESKALNTAEGPMIIISASGMAEAGRIVHHLSNGVSDPRNTVILVGYCAEGSLGARLRERPEFITIYGEQKPLKADVEMMDSFSGHGDQNEMLSYLQSVKTKRLKQSFLVHGERNGMTAMQQEMQKTGFGSVHMPLLGDVVPLQA